MEPSIAAVDKRAALLGVTGDGVDDLISAVVDGWQHAAAGRIKEARVAYFRAEQMLPLDVSIGPELSVLRHNVGRATGQIIPVPPTETRVVSFVLPDQTIESSDAWGMKLPAIDVVALEQNIRAFVDGFNPRHHIKNLIRELPHTLVLSTGRCGTVSLFRLFEARGLISYHSFWWMVSMPTRWEMMCRLIDGQFDRDSAAHLWAQTRAAEWLGAMAAGRPMIDFNHTDTTFAPVFAALHPKSRFIHLHRDPEAVFKSFFTKDQWQEGQLRPMLCAFSPEFRFYRTGHDLPECIAWYIHFTATIAEAMGRVVGPGRYLDVCSDKLFAQDRDEIGRLIEFTGVDITIDDAVEHFATRFNEKADRVTLTPDQTAEPLLAFRRAMSRLQQTGRL